jgi:hypothetical protein
MNQSKHSSYRTPSPIRENHETQQLFDNDLNSSIESIQYDEEYIKKIAKALESSDEDEMSKLEAESSFGSFSFKSDDGPPGLIRKYFESIEQCGDENLIKPDYRVCHEEMNSTIETNQSDSPEIEGDDALVNTDKRLSDFKEKELASGKGYIDGYKVILDKSYALKNQSIDINEEFIFYISDIESPIHFWFHATDDFSLMESQFQYNYNNLERDDLKMIFDSVEEGMLVACYIKYYKMWHRARIIKKDNETRNLKMFYFDYGSVGIEEISSIRYLMEEYADIPAYAYRGRIPFLQPRNGKLTWSLEDVRKFSEGIDKKKLTAKVINFNQDERVYELEIFKNLENGKKESARDWILRENIADEVEECDILPFCYHFPNFDALETTFLRYSDRKLKENYDKYNHWEALIETNFFSRLNSDTMHNKNYANILKREDLKSVQNYMENVS